MTSGERPYIEIVNSDLSDEEKLEMVAQILDDIKAGGPEIAFLVDMVVGAHEKAAYLDTQLKALAETTQKIVDELIKAVPKLRTLRVRGK
jgi:uncharacterized protein Yka (UPF0111/DUF47 family)